MLRYEVTSPSTIVLVSGTAEIFGTELVCGSELHLSPGQRGTVATFHGCRLVVSGSGIAAFPIAASEDQDILHVYLNLHASLETLRQKANEEQSRGPRVLVCGHDSVGKSTLCRTLASYAARRKHKPILVDVNVGLNQVRMVPFQVMCKMGPIFSPFPIANHYFTHIMFSFSHNIDIPSQTTKI